MVGCRKGGFTYEEVSNKDIPLVELDMYKHCLTPTHVLGTIPSCVADVGLLGALRFLCMNVITVCCWNACIQSQELKYQYRCATAAELDSHL